MNSVFLQIHNRTNGTPKRPTPFWLLALLLLLPPMLTACRYNYVPLVPPRAQVTMPPRIFGAELVREGENLRLTARVEGDFRPSFMEVRWFDGRREIASDAVYLDGDMREASFTLPAPEAGAYRAVLSLGGTVLRQIELYEARP